MQWETMLYTASTWVLPILIVITFHEAAPGSSSERTTERSATRRLGLEQRAEHLRPPFLKADVALQSALQQGLDPLPRFRPCQRGLKGGDGVEEPVGGRQRDLVDKILRGGDGTPIEGSDPTRKRVDEAVQLGIG